MISIQALQMTGPGSAVPVSGRIKLAGAAPASERSVRPVGFSIHGRGSNFRDRLPGKAEGRMMPTSVVVSITALVVMLGLNLVLGAIALLHDPTSIVRVAVSLGLGLLILWGMVVGHRLAWQWGRILGILAAVLLTIVGVITFVGTEATQVPAWARFLTGSMVLLQAACLYTIFFSLGQSSAKHHFNLRCPSCGKFTGDAADFFFNRAKCKACGAVW
jgi:hypothetical protein